MPTVMRLDGLRVVIYPDDHRPPHVHVTGSGREAVFQLAGPVFEELAKLGIHAEAIARLTLARARRRI